MIPIEILYNERHEVNKGGQSRGPFFDVATITVEPERGRLIIQFPESGHIVMTHKGWETLIQEVNIRFEEVQSHGTC